MNSRSQCQHIQIDSKTQEEKPCNAKKIAAIARDSNGNERKLCIKHSRLAMYKVDGITVTPVSTAPVIGAFTNNLPPMPPMQAPAPPPPTPTEPPKKKKKRVKWVETEASSTEAESEGDDDKSKMTSALDKIINREKQDDKKKKKPRDPIVEAAIKDIPNDEEEEGSECGDADSDEGVVDEEQAKKQASLRRLDKMVMYKVVTIACAITEKWVPETAGMTMETLKDPSIEDCFDAIAEEYSDEYGLAQLPPEYRLLACLAGIASNRYLINTGMAKPIEGVNHIPVKAEDKPKSVPHFE